MTVPEALDTAFKLHQSGDLRQAQTLYRQILQFDPQQPDALHLCGLIAHALGQHAVAADLIGQALRTRPGFAEAHCNLGVVLKHQGQLDEAAACYRRALRIRPELADAHNSLGVICMEQGRTSDAAKCFRVALRLAPNLAEAHNNLANLHSAAGKIDEAAAGYREAVRHKPDFAIAHGNLGMVLWKQGKLDEAATAFRLAVHFMPNYAEGHNNLGIILREQGYPEEAEACHAEALRLEPDHAEIHNDLGCALLDQNKADEALASFAEAVRLRPEDAVYHYNLAHVLLLKGDYLRGWAEYEWRLRRQDLPPRYLFSQPVWDGSALAGRTILLHAEQGFGDTIQFVRYAPLVKERGGIVIVECPKSLVKLLAGCAGIDRVVASDDPLPAFDTHAPLLSLPHIFKTILATIPTRIPYLFADPGRIADCESRIADSNASPRDSNPQSAIRNPRLKVGIAWQADPRHHRSSTRSVPLTAFAGLAEIEGVRLISLQYGPGTEQLAATAGWLPVLDLGDRIRDFAETAAVIMNLDLVITIDSVLAHCAGAVGAPVWVLLRSAACFRWMQHRADSPWYPSMRLFRQSRRGDWDGVFAQVRQALQERVGQMEQGE